VLTTKELEQSAADGSIDTVVVAFTAMQGRLMGRRLHTNYFLDGDISEHGVEGCNYLLAFEMEGAPVPGYEMASWERGYGDFRIVLDMGTLRRIPWLEGTALVLADVARLDGSPVAPSPRQVLKRQLERAAELGYTAMFGSELEFFLLKETERERMFERG
jgi:glutamine synthetase